MTTENIQINIREDGSRVVVVNINNIANSANSAAIAVTGLNQAMELLKKAWNALKGIASIFLEMADAMNLLESRLKLATKSSEDFKRAQEDIYRISQANNTALKETGSLYVRLSDPIKRLGGGTKEVAAIVEGFTASLKISGATAGESAGAILQFSQALGSGRLMGDEFRSLSENAPRFMQVLADSLNVPTGALKAMSSQGKLTSDVIGNALITNLTKLREEATKVGETVQGAFSDLQNDAMRTTKAFDDLTGVSKTTSESIQGFSVLVAQLGNIFKEQLATGIKDTTGEFDTMAFVISSLGPIMETFLLFGSEILSFFNNLARDLGGLSAIAVRLAQGDMAGASAIWDQMARDQERADKNLTAFQGRVANLTADALKLREKMKMGTAGEGANANLKATTSEEDLVKIRMKLTGVTENYLKDLSTLENAYASNLVTTEEYVRLVGELATKTWDASVAGKEAAKNARLNDTRVKQLQDALLLEKAGVAEQKDIYDSRLKMIDVYHKNFNTSEADFYGAQKRAREEYIKSETDSYNRQAALLQNFKAKTPREVEDAKIKYNKLTADHNEFLRQFAGAETEAQLDQMGRDKKTIESSNQMTNDYISKLNEQALALEKANESRETSKSQVDSETVAILQNAVAYQQAFIAQQNSTNATADEIAQAPAVLKYLQDLLAARTRINDALEVKESDDFARKASERAIKDWKKAGESIADSLKNAFGKGGKAVGEMFKAYADGQAGRLKAEKDLTAAKKLNDDDPQKIQAIKDAQLAGAQAQLKSYADMGQAATVFFNENSKGYKAMTAAVNVLRLAEIALSVVKGVNAVLTQGSGDPYSAFARMAAMTAIVVGLGVALSGGGGGTSPAISEVRQKANGTGSVLGDTDAKTTSIQKSLDIIAKDSGLGLVHFSSMDRSLQQLVSGIGNLSNLLVRGTNLTSKLPEDTGSSAQKLFMSLQPFWSVGAKSVGKIVGKIFGGGKTVNDTGIKIDSGSLATLLQGVKSYQYTDITKKGGWFSSDKQYEETNPLGNEIDNQFTMIIQSLADTIKSAAGILGLSGIEFTDKLNGFVVDIEKISTKDMTGEEIQTALETAFSKLGDDMANFAISGLQEFQKVGEGSLETLTRVANNLVQVKDVFAVLGQTMKASGLDAVRLSESFIDIFGSVEDLTEATGNFINNFLSDSQRLAPIQKSLAEALTAMGYSANLSSEEYAKLVLAQDLNTAQGQETYASLLKLADAMKAVDDYSKKLSETRFNLELQVLELEGRGTEALALQRQKELAAMDASLRPLQERINLLTDERAAVESALDGLKASIDKAKNIAKADFDAQSAILKARQSSAADAYEKATDALQASVDTATTSVNDLKSLQSSLKSALDTIRQTINPSQVYQQAQNQIADALKVAQTTGKLPKNEDIQKALSLVTNPSSDNFSTRQEYEAAMAQANNNIYQLNELTGGQLTEQQKLLDTSKQQLELLKKNYDLQAKAYEKEQELLQAQYDKQIEELDAQYTNAQAQVNAILGVQTAVLSVKDSIALLASNIGSLADTIGSTPIPNMPGSGSGSPNEIETLYKSILGRGSDAAGLEFWTQQMANGASLSQIASAMYNSTEYQSKSQVSDAVAQGYNSQTATSSQGQSGNTVANTELTKAMQDQAVALQKIATATEGTQEILNNVTAGGSAMQTEAA